MGIYDRDYMRRRPDGSRPFPLKTLLAAGIILLVLIYAVTQWQKTSSQPLKSSRVASRTATAVPVTTPTSAPRLGKGSLRVNVNTATALELETIMGIGPAKAKMIIDRRPYASADELVTRGAMGAKLLENIRNFVKTEGETERLPPN